jgi:hypothetical protein
MSGIMFALRQDQRRARRWSSQAVTSKGALGGTAEVMALKSWKPGTSRWAYLLTAIYLLVLAVGLPMTIALHQGQYWVLFALVMLGGICTIASAYIARRDIRRRAVSGPGSRDQAGL